MRLILSSAGKETWQPAKLLERVRIEKGILKFVFSEPGAKLLEEQRLSPEALLLERAKSLEDTKRIF